MFTPLDVKPALLILFFVYIGISNFTLFKLLQKTTLNPDLVIVTLLASITAQTWGTGMAFGLKDHLILICLIPFVTLQYLLTTTTSKISNTISIPASIMGGIALCLKPHYIIIQLAFLIHRLLKTKSVKNCVISIDTIIPILCAIAYLVLIYIFTPDFIETILPQVSALYGIDKPFPIGMNLKAFMITIISLLVVFATIAIERNEERGEIKKIAIATATLSALCIIPYIMQDKGFYYHTIPFLGFGIMTMFCAIYSGTRLALKHKDISLWIAMALTGVLTYANTTGNKAPVMTPGQYKAQPIVDFIDENAWNRIYATYDMKSMLAPLPYIIDVKNGSRFGQIWNLHALSILIGSAQSDQESEDIKNQMMNIVNMMAEDIIKNKPSVIAIPLYPETQDTNDPSSKFFEFLMANDNFANAFKNYTKQGTVDFNKSLTPNNTDEDNIIKHDMYILKKDHEL